MAHQWKTPPSGLAAATANRHVRIVQTGPVLTTDIIILEDETKMDSR